MSVSSLESAGSASPLKPAASAPLSSASGTPTGSATSPTTGRECPSSGMSTTWTPLNAQLWPTATVNDSTGSKYCYARNRDPILQLPVAAEAHLWPTPRSEKTSSENPATWQARNDAGDVATPPLAMSASLHSSSPQACLASQPVPLASARAAQMTAGSGRRLSAWLNGSDPSGACLKTLLDSPRWHSPLRSLAWTLKGYGGVPDAPCAKSSEDLTFWDMTSRETSMASLGFRLCRLSVSALSTGGTGCGLSPDAEMWLTPNCPRAHDTDDLISAEYATQNQSTIHRQAQLHAQLWTTPTVRDKESILKVTLGAGSKAKGNELIQPLAVQADTFQTGQPPNSNAEPTASRGQLNPDFVCWLMGYPAGWLNYADSETQSSRKSPRKSSPLSVPN